MTEIGEPITADLRRSIANDRLSRCPAALMSQRRKKFPCLMKHYGDNGKVYVVVAALDTIVDAKRLLKGREVAK